MAQLITQHHLNIAQQITQLGMCGATPLEDWGMVRSYSEKPSWAIVAFMDVERRTKFLRVFDGRMIHGEGITGIGKCLTCRDVNPDPQQDAREERLANDRALQRRIERRGREREELDTHDITYRGERERDLPTCDSPSGLPGLWGDTAHGRPGVRIKPWSLWNNDAGPHQAMAPLPLVAMRTRLRGGQGNKPRDAGWATISGTRG